MKKIYFAIVAATAIVQTIHADYLNDSWGFKDFEVKKVYIPTSLTVEAINKEIEKASENGGGIVKIPAGTITANTPIIIKDNVKLKGTLKDGKRVTFIDANYDMAKGKRGLIVSYHTTNTTVENLNLNVKGHNLTAISYVEGDQHNFLIANNSIKNVGFPKYEVAKAKGILPTGYTTVDGISLHDWGEKEYSTDFTIKNNDIKNYSEHGINLHYVKRFVIDHNRMENGVMGIDISTGSREGEVLNNDISDVVAGAKIIGNRGAYDQEIYFHNNYSHDNKKVAYHDDVSGKTYDDGGRGLERQFEGRGIHIYDNILKGYDSKHDILYFSGASKYQDDLHDNNVDESVINKPEVKKPKPNTTMDIQTKAFIPKLDFSKSDVYGNGQVVYVSNPKELQQSLNSAKPYTTIILKDGKYKNMNVSFPKAKHHITIKAQNRHGAILYPRGRDDASAIYLPQVSYENEMIHDINFVDLEVSGDGGSQEFLFTPGVLYGHHHIYFKGIKMHGLFMGLYSGLSSHDWTMDGCEFYNSTASYMWYMMGYHQAVINSVMYNNSYYSLSIRGCYPPQEKYDYYHHENNVQISSRKSHFLSSDDWTHLIANNTFGSNFDNERLSNAHIALYYNADEGERVSEDVYFPPQNVMIFNNAFVDSGLGEKKMLKLMANRGINRGKVDSVNGIFIRNNFTDKDIFLEADTAIMSIDLSTNHKSVLEEKFGFDDANRDYHISYDSILKDAAVDTKEAPTWDFDDRRRDKKPDVGAFEAK
jgi:hypothetical protein